MSHEVQGHLRLKVRSEEFWQNEFTRGGNAHPLHYVFATRTPWTVWFSKSFKLGFSNTWTENFQMHKLCLEKAEELEIKLPTFVGLWRKQGNSRKTSTSAALTTLKPLTVCMNHSKLWKILKQMAIPDQLPCLLRNWYAGQEATVRTSYGTTDWFKIGKGRHQGCIL